MAFHISQEHVSSVEYLIGCDGDQFGYSGNIKVDLPSITSVHPMRKDELRDHMKKAGTDWNVITNLIESGSLRQV